jgi:hypothetical protein
MILYKQGKYINWGKTEISNKNAIKMMLKSIPNLNFNYKQLYINFKEDIITITNFNGYGEKDNYNKQLITDIELLHEYILEKLYKTPFISGTFEYTFKQDIDKKHSFYIRFTDSQVTIFIDYGNNEEYISLYFT